MTTPLFFSYRNSELQPFQGTVVREFPLQLIVNKREIATLIASPHDLRFLVAGFLRLQGFVHSLDDFKMFSVCEDFGTANVQIATDLPDKLKPVLTSGCGTGISFSMPGVSPHGNCTGMSGKQIAPSHIFSLMNELAKRADSYRAHGGIHSAAVGRDGSLLLYAEDLGRHNTLDRIAGEALFKGIDLCGTIMVTSGRVSTEMVAKAALLGVNAIASRTSPTDMAIKLCEQYAICLAGYVKNNTFTVYCHPELIEQYSDSGKIQGVTAAILAGGASSRMGTNKALLKVDDEPIISISYKTLAKLFREVIIVTNTPEEYDFLPCRKVPDIFPDIGSISGLHSALSHSTTERTFVIACDMPFIDPAVIRHLCEMQLNGYDAITPLTPEGQEPLHAVYSSDCKTIFETAIRNNQLKIIDILSHMKTKLIPWDTFQNRHASQTPFLNINTPKEYEAVIRGQQPACASAGPKKMN